MCTDPIIKNLSVLGKEGLLPTDKFTLLHMLKITFHALFFSLMTGINIANIVSAIKTGSDMELNRATCIIIPLTQTLIKGVTILINKKHFYLVLKDLRSDIFNSHSMNLNVHIELVYKVSDLLRKYYSLAIGAFIFVAAILPFITNIRMMMPPPFEMGKYVFFYKFLHFLMTIYLAVNSISLDVMYMSLMALCIAQLNILEERLMNVFEESRSKGSEHLPAEDSFNSEFIVVEQTILKQCIALHEKINK